MKDSFVVNNCSFKASVPTSSANFLKIETKKVDTNYLLSSSKLPPKKNISNNLLVPTRLRNSDIIINNVKKCSSNIKEEGVTIFDIPTKIEATYKDNYNILNIDDIIRKKLRQEKYTELDILKLKYKNLEDQTNYPQNYVTRETTINNMMKIKKEIELIEEGGKLTEYHNKVNDLISAYKKFNGLIKTVSFEISNNDDADDEINNDEEKFEVRNNIIERYLEIAANYIEINIVKISNFKKEICHGCGTSLSKISPNEDGVVRCPNQGCQTENIILVQPRIINEGVYNNNAPESIDNFLKAFMYYQGLQNVKLSENLFSKLDEHFRKIKKPIGDEIKKLPLNSRGMRGDTDHKMMWTALSSIGFSEYFKHSNYICNIYWGWVLPNVMHFRETIINHYNITQQIYNKIPVEERGRDSSLGVPYRLWKHLQLVGHKCYMDEFRIVASRESLNCHDRLWKRMTDEANLIDPSIYYIP
jgi:hypothetical protein